MSCVADFRRLSVYLQPSKFDLVGDEPRVPPAASANLLLRRLRFALSFHSDAKDTLRKITRSFFPNHLLRNNQQTAFPERPDIWYLSVSLHPHETQFHPVPTTVIDAEPFGKAKANDPSTRSAHFPTTSVRPNQMCWPMSQMGVWQDAPLPCLRFM